MKLMITTQFWENYGSPHNPYWKMKGGNDYVVKNVTDDADALDKMMSVKNIVEHSGDYSKEYIIDWALVNDDYVTEFELFQLKYDGVIKWTPEELML